MLKVRKRSRGPRILGANMTARHAAQGSLCPLCDCSYTLYSQEVSAFGEDGEGDDLDLWTVRCSGQHWEREASVRFQHVGTSVFLSVTGEQYGNPIRGQHEVHGMPSANAHNTWKAMEGIFIKPG